MVTSQIKYYGIDIGDGETAAATVSNEGAVLPHVLTLGDTKSMLSVVGRLNGTPVIGDQALLRQRQGVRDIQARFKSRYLTDELAVTDIRDFARGLYEVMRTELDGVAQPYIALGVPAGWTNAEREKYAGIVSSAGFTNLHTVAESRAAFLFARYDKDIGLSNEELGRPALVIDIGSSTTDFAYIVDSKESEVGVFGDKALGGGLLDQLILEDALERSPKAAQIRAVFNENPEWRSVCELEARKAKERYFSSEANWTVDPYVKKVLILADVNNPMSLSISLNAERMEKILLTPIASLDGLTFPQQLKKSLEEAAKNTATHPPELLILTGGASRMRFFQQACQDAFPSASISLCAEPEYCIARGLSIASRIDYKLTLFRRRIEEFFAGGMLKEEINRHLPALQAKLSDVLLARIMNECVKPVLKEDFASADQLNTALSQRIQKVFTEQGRTEASDEVIAKWISDELTDTQRQLDELCVENDVERADMSLAKVAVKVELNKMRILPKMMPAFLCGIILTIMQMFPKLMLQSKVQDALRKELIDPKSNFAKSLANGLEAELRAQIQKNVEKVEIIIN